MGRDKEKDLEEQAKRAFKQGEEKVRNKTSRNKLAGKCSICGTDVAPQEGRWYKRLYCEECGSEILNSGP